MFAWWLHLFCVLCFPSLVMLVAFYDIFQNSSFLAAENRLIHKPKASEGNLSSINSDLCRKLL